MTPCALCGHYRVAHTVPAGDCRACPPADPCPGFDAEPDHEPEETP